MPSASGHSFKMFVGIYDEKLERGVKSTKGKSEQAAVVGSDSGVYKASHFVPKLFMQSVNAAVEADTSPRVFNDDSDPALCSLPSSANPSPNTYATVRKLRQQLQCESHKDLSCKVGC